MDNVYAKLNPMEQIRWNNANTDSLFYAGCQSFINRQLNFNSSTNFNQYYFNLVQQPINAVTGYQRQHRKSGLFFPADNSDPHTTDQYTKLAVNYNQRNGLDEVFSKSCEFAGVAGLNLMQPYLDYMGDDPAQGEMKVKIWEYNSFMTDPYWRNPDMSDCNLVWCQEFITSDSARIRFGDKVDQAGGRMMNHQRNSRFYFLPENYNMNRSDLMILSYVWYKSTKNKKRLYSRKRNQFFDFAGGDAQLAQILYSIDDFEEVTVKVPAWKVAVVLNDKLMFNGFNPLGLDTECPFIPNFWNYDPHLNHQDLRSRSLTYVMRAPQFLFNHKVITNNDIAAATINAGYKRKVGAVANEDNLKKVGQGWDILINDGYEMTDVEKIIPTAVPESDLMLAQQMNDLIQQTSGINMENWAGQDDSQISTITALIKQAANLMVFQKYFDQWDNALKLLEERKLQIALNNWNAAKVEMIIGEEPSPFFYSRIFAKYQCVVEEGLSTPTQKNYQAKQLLEINERFGREVFPPSFIIKDMNIQGRAEAMQFLQQQEQAMQQAQQEEQMIKMTFEEAKLKELYSKAVSNLATARERNGRAEADIGLFEERLSEITHNRAMATKAKMESIEKLIDVIQKFGEIETALAADQVQDMSYQQESAEDREKLDAKQTAMSNEFLTQIMGNMGQEQQQPEMAQQGVF